jgi:hypothetical protein
MTKALRKARDFERTGALEGCCQAARTGVPAEMQKLLPLGVEQVSVVGRRKQVLAAR